MKVKLHLNPIEIDLPPAVKTDKHLWQWLQGRLIEQLKAHQHKGEIHPSIIGIDEGDLYHK